MISYVLSDDRYLLSPNISLAKCTLLNAKQATYTYVYKFQLWLRGLVCVETFLPFPEFRERLQEFWWKWFLKKAEKTAKITMPFQHFLFCRLLFRENLRKIHRIASWDGQQSPSRRACVLKRKFSLNCWRDARMGTSALLYLYSLSLPTFMEPFTSFI